MLHRAWLAGALWMSLQAKAWACGRSDLQALIDSAQTLAAQTDSWAKKLASCPDEVAEASYWQGFYQKLAGVKTAAPVHINAKQELPGEVGRDIVQAYAGRWLGLKGKFDSGDPRYTEAAPVYLALARAQVAVGAYGPARTCYETYLRLQGNAYAVEAELLYTYIWEGRYDQALREFAGADLHQTPPEFSRAVSNGLALINRLQPPAAAPSEVPPETTFGAELEGFLLRSEMQRLTTGLRFHGPVDLAWHHHTVKELLYDQETLLADEVTIGAEHYLQNRVTLRGHLGYLTSAKNHYLGDALVRLRIKNRLMIGAGGDRQPLFTLLPLSKSSIGLVQDRIYLEGGWPDQLVLRSAYLRDLNLAPFERHELDVRLPLLPGGASGQTFKVLASGLYEIRPQPSPDYESYHTTSQLAVGAAWEQRLSSEWSGSAELLYRLSLVQPHGDANTDRQSGALLKANLSSRLSGDWYAVGRLAYGLQETPRPALPLEQSLTLLGAVEYRH